VCARSVQSGAGRDGTVSSLLSTAAAAWRMTTPKLIERGFPSKIMLEAPQTSLFKPQSSGRSTIDTLSITVPRCKEKGPLTVAPCSFMTKLFGTRLSADRSAALH